MKQHISTDQLQQLTPLQQDKLREWWEPRRFDIFTKNGSEFSFMASDGHNALWEGGSRIGTKDECLPLLSIGQCIELLREKDIDALAHEFWQQAYGIEGNDFDVVDELLDRLWESIKSIL